ncbi:MAG: DCC1-like thiol-disulfide oxidoreductase family protein [Pseudomonadota bacterium]
MSGKDQQLLVFYDGDCPFCDNYIKLLKLKEAVGSVELIDARQGDDPRVLALAALVDLNEGIAAQFGENTYHAEEAMAVIAKLSTQNRLTNKINAWIFTRPSLSRILYPILKSGRAITLRLLGRSAIKHGHSS